MIFSKIRRAIKEEIAAAGKKKIIIVVVAAILMFLFVMFESDSFTILSKGRSGFRTGFFICSVIAAIMVLALFFVQRMRKIEIEKIFVVLALFFGLVFVNLNPPLQNPDEYYHFQKSIDVSYGNFSPFYLHTDQDIYKLTGPKTVMETKWHEIYQGTHETDDYKDKYAAMSMSEETVQVKSTGGFHPFISYIPQAIAVLFARLFRMNALNTLYLVRAFNAIIYAIMGYFAIKMIPYGKNILLALALSPICVSQAASASTDGVCNMLCFLFLALAMKYSLEERKGLLGVKDMAPFAVILLLLAFYKYLYIVIGLLVFLIPMEKFGGKKKYFKTFAMVVIPLAVLFVIYYTYVTGNLIHTSTYNEGVDPGKQIAWILANPRMAIGAYENTFERLVIMWMEQFNILGSLNFRLGILTWTVPAWLLFVAVTDVNPKLRLRTRKKILLLFTGILTVLLVMLSMFLVWTKVGQLLIEGVQPRYFVPALPLLFLGFQLKGIRNETKGYGAKVAAVTVFWLMYAIFCMSSGAY